MPEDTKELVAEIVSNYLRKNPVAPTDLPALITSVHQSLSSLGTPPVPQEEPRIPAVPIRRSVTPDAVVCLECGWKGQTLRRHLTSAHDLTPNEYRTRWDLPTTHALTAPSYTKRRSVLAKQLGLGRPRVPAESRQ